MGDPLFLHRPFSRATLQLVDDVLLAQAGLIWEKTRSIAPPGAPIVQAPWQTNWRAEDERQSLLGQLLLRVADYVNGGYSTMTEEAEHAMKQILRMLYGDPLGEGYTIPEQFHKTELGKLFDQAHRHILTGEDVAVKIQYPGIARTIREDFRNFFLFLLPGRYLRLSLSLKV